MKLKICKIDKKDWKATIEYRGVLGRDGKLSVPKELVQDVKDDDEFTCQVTDKFREKLPEIAEGLLETCIREVWIENAFKNGKKNKK